MTIAVSDLTPPVPPPGATCCLEARKPKVWAEVDLINDSQCGLLGSQADCGTSSPDHCDDTIISTLDLVSCVSNQRVTSNDANGDCHTTDSQEKVAMFIMFLEICQ